MKFKKKKKIVGVTYTGELFPSIVRPKFADTLKFPSNITELGTMNITDLIGKYTALYAYANQALSAANIEILKCQSAIDLMKQYLTRSNPMMNSQEKWRRDASVDSDPRMEKLIKDQNVARQRKEQCQMYVANFDKYIAALSRELTRKTHESDFARK